MGVYMKCRISQSHFVEESATKAFFCVCGLFTFRFNFFIINFLKSLV